MIEVSELTKRYGQTTAVKNLTFRVRPGNVTGFPGPNGHHDGVRRVVILGRGGVGKSALARQLSDVTGIPAVELDALFWQPGPTPMDPSRWAACQNELIQRSCWILDGDLGPYDTALQVRLRAADTIVILDFTFLRCAWRTPTGDEELIGFSILREAAARYPRGAAPRRR